MAKKILIDELKDSEAVKAAEAESVTGGGKNHSKKNNIIEYQDGNDLQVSSKGVIEFQDGTDLMTQPQTQSKYQDGTDLF